MQPLQLRKKELGCCSIAKHRYDGVSVSHFGLVLEKQVRYPVTFLGALPVPLLLLCKGELRLSTAFLRL